MARADKGVLIQLWESEASAATAGPCEDAAVKLWEGVGRREGW